MSDYQGNIIIKNPATPTGPSAYGSAPGMWSLNEVAYWIKQGVWPNPAITPDTYFPYVSLLLSTTSLGNANNNLFVDSSGAFNPISRNGNPTQGSFSPYSTNWSNYFDGSGDYFTVPYTTANFDWWTSGVDFTIEAWVFATNLSTWQYTDSAAGVNSVMVGNAAATSEVNYWSFGPLANGTVRFKYYNGANNFVTSTATITANTWNHVAMTKTSSGITVYVNGVAGTTTAISGTPQSSTGYPLIVGQINNTTASGYISNLRVVRGTAIYSGNFTPPTAPLTAVTNTTLLTCQSNRFRDASTNNLTLTITGDTRVTDFSPFSPAYPGLTGYNQSDITNWSGFFDGTGDYLSVANSSANNLGTNDFTIELWFKSNTGTMNTHACLVASYSSATSGSWAFKAQSGTSGYIQFASYGPSWNDWVTTTNIAADQAWHHCAVTRSGNTLRIFVDGTVRGTWDISGASSFTGGGHPLTTGFMAQDSTSYLNGNLSNVRIVQGTALYTSNFTPPTSALTAISGTVYLTCQNPAFTDNSTNNLVITQNGNPTVAGNSPFNTVGYWSNYFDGSGDYLTVADSTALNLAGGSFTLETWIYPNGNYSDYRTIITKRILGGSTTSYQLYLRISTGYLSFFNGTEYVSSATPIANAWNHVAAVYDGTNINLYLNGTRVLQTAVTITNQSANLYIGSFPTYGENVVGYLSNLRILKGVAAYSGSTYTVPTTPLTAISGTSLLTCQNGRIIDNSTNAATVTPTGNVSPQNFNPFYTATIASNGGSIYFDGSGDWLQVPRTQLVVPATNDFTLECWMYPTTNSSGQHIMGPVESGTTGDWGMFRHTDNTLGLYVGSTGADTYGGTSIIRTNQWNHVALSRVSGTLYKCVNGAIVSVSFPSSLNNNTSYPLTIAADNNGDEAFYTGWMAGIRIINGTGIYSGSSYTVPTSPYGITSNTTLLINGMNAGIYDATTINDLETVGNAQVTTAVSKFGGSSIALDGTGDYLKAPNSDVFAFRTGDFTVEMWAYFADNAATNRPLFDTGVNSNTGRLLIRQGNDAGTSNVVNAFVSGTTISSPTISFNQWTHVAVVRQSGTVKIYINGTGGTGVSASADLTQNGCLVGAFYDQLAWNFTGYIDDLRVTRGVARYTSNFTPPTQPFPIY